MSTWLSITVIAGAQIIGQLICLIGGVWQERARAASVRRQMEAAASSGTIVCERRHDGSTLLIVPVTAAREQASATELLLGALTEKSPR